MTFHEIHSWTFCGLVRAFLDLAVVYFLLCVSATVFIPSKILEVVGFCLPCPCTGFYGNQNPNLCLHRLLFSWPKRKIYLVLDSVKHRFPFDLILVDDQMGKNRNLLRENHHTDGVPLLQSAACCSKGNRIMFQRPRRRRASVEYGKLFRKEWEFLALDKKQDLIPGGLCDQFHILHQYYKFFKCYELMIYCYLARIATASFVCFSGYENILKINWTVTNRFDASQSKSEGTLPDSFFPLIVIPMIRDHCSFIDVAVLTNKD